MPKSLAKIKAKQKKDKMKKEEKDEENNKMLEN